MTKANLEAAREAAQKAAEKRREVGAARMAGADPEAIWSLALEIADAEALVKATEAALSKIDDPILRRILVLRYCRAETWPKVAVEMQNIPEGTCRVMAHRFLKTLDE